MHNLTEEKKMPNHQEFSSSYCNYVPAVLRHHKDNWQIEYYVYSPITKQLERKRIKVNRLRLHCTTLSMFKQQANEIIQSINIKLAAVGLRMVNRRMYVIIHHWRRLCLFILKRSRRN